MRFQIMSESTNILHKTIEKYEEFNEQLRDFTKSLLLFEKMQHQSLRNDDNGISILNVKNELLLHYMTNLCTIMLKKSAGQSLTNDKNKTILLRLCEIRTYIEKTRPIEQKLQYQIDKLLKMDSSSGEQDFLKHRANIDNFDEETSHINGDKNGEQEKKMDEDEPKLYRPPKLVPLAFEDDISTKGKTLKRLEYLKRRAYYSNVLQDYKEKYSDAPEEYFDTDRSRLLKDNRLYKDKVNFEEDYLKRLPQTKLELKQLNRSISNRNNLNTITDNIQDGRLLYEDEDDDDMDFIGGDGGGRKNKNKSKTTMKGRKRLKKKGMKRLKSKGKKRA
ncbi:unnamed protein product [Didymodactylos carnosus]|uniref:Uncharacterized protein n=1 Tax=Didymodactylos carnosus TaxID=1234261 RepID=A0A813QUY5_9BILA|nr:unnamed protein product [Didymodactylos carnosus]CAF0827691.1 unnamed protein product [Didymodactylos carnosus]CAF3555069.1 unnamed protein product [Didymodactylos carnosus]CAF3612151.1 unnamed protein product [Didymodactylos carnosus]